VSSASGSKPKIVTPIPPVSIAPNIASDLRRFGFFILLLYRPYGIRSSQLRSLVITQAAYHSIEKDSQVMKKDDSLQVTI
jgi:hypothetical protein